VNLSLELGWVVINCRVAFGGSCEKRRELMLPSCLFMVLIR
jgi:hypothetical protein